MKDKSDYLKVFGIEIYWIKAFERFREWAVEGGLSLKEQQRRLDRSLYTRHCQVGILQLRYAQAPRSDGESTRSMGGIEKTRSFLTRSLKILTLLCYTSKSRNAATMVGLHVWTGSMRNRSKVVQRVFYQDTYLIILKVETAGIHVQG